MVIGFEKENSLKMNTQIKISYKYKILKKMFQILLNKKNPVNILILIIVL